MLGISRSVYRYQPSKPNDQEIEEELHKLAEQKPRWGFGKMMAYLKNQNYTWNHKRVRRVYCELGLNLRVKPKKRLPNREPKPLMQPET